MQQLTRTFVDNCPIEDEYRLRGMAMTRIEVFVDAAFAFAITMLVISIDQIPNSVPALIDISKQIPAFAVSVFQLIFIWHTHSKWSRQFGLEDSKTVLMSAILLIVVLVYIYPLKMMFSGFFYWVSDGFFPSHFVLNNFTELRYLFAYFAVGFILIALIFTWMYKHSLNLKQELRLNTREIYLIKTNIQIRIGILAIGVLALVLPFIVSDKMLPFTGFCYALIPFASRLIKSSRRQKWNKTHYINPAS